MYRQAEAVGGRQSQLLALGQRVDAGQNGPRVIRRRGELYLRYGALELLRIEPQSETIVNGGHRWKIGCIHAGNRCVVARATDVQLAPAVAHRSASGLYGPAASCD